MDTPSRRAAPALTPSRRNPAFSIIRPDAGLLAKCFDWIRFKRRLTAREKYFVQDARTRLT